MISSRSTRTAYRIRHEHETITHNDHIVLEGVRCMDLTCVFDLMLMYVGVAVAAWLSDLGTRGYINSRITVQERVHRKDMGTKCSISSPGDTIRLTKGNSGLESSKGSNYEE